MDQETEFLTALQSAVSFQVDGSRLDMFNADGARALDAAAAGSDTPKTRSTPKSIRLVSNLQPTEIADEPV